MLLLLLLLVCCQTTNVLPNSARKLLRNTRDLRSSAVVSTKASQWHCLNFAFIFNVVEGWFEAGLKLLWLEAGLKMHCGLRLARGRFEAVLWFKAGLKLYFGLKLVGSCIVVWNWFQAVVWLEGEKGSESALWFEAGLRLVSSCIVVNSNCVVVWG